MLQLYDKNKNKIKGLTKYKDFCIESVLKTGDKTLSFLYPSKFIDGIVEEGYIRNKTDEFVIKEIADHGEWTSIKAQMNVEDLEGKAWEHFNTTEQTIENCLNLACAGTGWTVQVNNVSKKRTVKKTNCSSWDLIQEAKKIYRVEIEFDTLNNVVKVYEKLGQDKGVYFSDEINLKALDIESNSYDFYTKIIAIGKENIKVEVENFQYSNKVKTLIWKDERYTVLENLREDAIAKLQELSKPRKSYSADVIDLANLNSKYKNILDYKLGDTITLIYKDKKIREKQRIVKIVEYPDEPERNSCEIANTTLDFIDIQKEFQDTADTVNNITEDNGTISEEAIKVAVKNLTIDKADINSLNAAVARIGTLEATKANITELNAVNAKITNLQANKAEITDLIAGNIKFDVATGGTLDLQTLLSKFVTGENGQFLNLTTDNVTISNALIKDIIAKNISVGDLKAGNIDSNRFNIVGTDGNLLIKDNTIQIKDSARVRVQIGKDASGDYSMYVWDKQGNLMFDALGLKSSAIKDKIIRDDMVADNANINGSKLNISSLITEVNKDNTQTLKASRISFDSTGQSLEVSFNSLKSNVDSKESRNLFIEKNTSDGYYNDTSFVESSGYRTSDYIEVNEGKIYTLCKFAIDGYHRVVTFDKDKNRIGTRLLNSDIALKYKIPAKIKYIRVSIEKTNKYKIEKGENSNPVWSIAPEDIEERIESNTTAISIAQDKIEGLIKESSITKGDVTTLKDNYTSIKATVDGINTTVASHTSSIGNLTTDLSGVSGKVATVETKQATLEQNLNGFKTTVSNTYSTKTELNTVKGTVTSVEQRINTVEQKVTATAITTTISSAINAGTSSITTTQFVMDKTGFTVKNGAIKIQNKAGTNVMTSDTNGNLTITGTFVNKNYNGVDAIKIQDTSIYFYDWERNGRELGLIYSSQLSDYPNVRGFSLAHNNEGYMTLGYKTSTGYNSYIVLDKYAKNPAYPAPIRVLESAVFQSAVNMQERVYVPNKICFESTYNARTPQIFKNTSDSRNILISQVSVNAVNDGYMIQSNTGGVLFSILAGSSYPAYFNTNVQINGSYTATGSKNSLQSTEHYGERLINAFETAEYYYSDIGFGKISDSGECYISIDDILQECVNLDCEYHIFTQQYNGKITTIDRKREYFVVYGEPGTEFSWQYIAKRIGYENVRLDQPDIDGYLDNTPVFSEDDLKIDTSEDVLMEELDFNLEEVLMEVGR